HVNPTTLLFVTYYFSCSGHHLDLPSFPTRRSSDLFRVLRLGPGERRRRALRRLLGSAGRRRAGALRGARALVSSPASPAWRPHRVHTHASRRLVVTGSRAARSAGRKPPIMPMTTAMISPRTTSSGVTLKLNTT